MSDNEYLEQINDHLNVMENHLYDIRTNVRNIENETRQQISGDKVIIRNQQQTINLIGAELLVMVAILLYLFIVRSLK